MPEPQSRVQQLLAQLESVRPAGNGWSARCPSHDDKNPSLSITVADSGKILLFCHAGCETADVIRAAGFEASLLNGAAPATQPKRKAKKPQTWENKKAAIAAAARSANGKAIAEYDYVDHQGIIELSVIRIAQPKGKTFRPIHPSNGRWHIGDPEGLLPLFNLPAVIAADLVLIAEGEGCVLAASEYGLTATTSAHGSNSAHKSDWRVLQGKDIVIWPDNDDPGRKYAQDVVDELRRLDPQATVRVVAPDGLGAGADIVDWIKAREAEGLDKTDTAEALAILLEGAETWSGASRSNSADSADSAPGGQTSNWPQPLPIVDQRPLPEFPIGTAFPPYLNWLREYFVALAECYQVPVDAVAMLALPIMALGISKRFEVEPHRGWLEQLSIYSMVLLPSGERKSALIRDLMSPVRSWQREKASGMSDDILRFQTKEMVTKDRLDQARKKAARSQEAHADLEDLAHELAELDSAKPRPPSLIVTEGTSEAVARTLALNEERAILAAAEGDAIDVMLGRYSGSPNLGVWLSGHSGDSIDCVRRGREPDRLEHPAMQVCLCIQPEAVEQLLSSRVAAGRGLLARFFFTCPTSRVGYRKLITQPVPTDLVDRFGTRIQQHLTHPVPKEPQIIRFTPEAQERFLAYRQVNERQLRPGGHLDMSRSWGSKLPGGLARIAGVFKAFESGGQESIDIETLECALVLSDYLTEQFQRVTVLMGDDKAVELARRIDAWICRTHKATFSRRDAYNQVKGSLDRVDEVDPALEVLIDRQRIRVLVSTSKGEVGRPPSPRYEVNPALTCEPEPPEQNPHNTHNSPSDDSSEAGGHRD